MQLLIKHKYFQFSVMFINEDYQTSSSLKTHQWHRKTKFKDTDLQ
jgi:hypothetical protein